MSKRRSNDDFAQEIESHIQIEAGRLVDEGLSPEEAQLAARRKFGNVTAVRETFYKSSRWAWLSNLSRDLRYALRGLRNTPVSTAVIVVSLALGIGFNTAIFSLADQALLRPLPVERPQELVQLQWAGSFEERGMGSMGYGSVVPYVLYQELREENDIFVALFSSAVFNISIEAGDVSEPVSMELVSGSYFPTLGVRPTIGRLFDDADDLERDAHPVVVLSHEYWSTHLNAKPEIVGETIRVNNFPMTVVGVAERGFRGIDWSLPPDLWVPTMMKARITPNWNGLDERRTRFLHVFGRLKPGLTREQAQAQLQPWFKAYLQADTEREGWPQVTDQQLQEFLSSDLNLLPGSQGESSIGTTIRQPVLILLASTFLVLLLACLNVANLSLARTLSRARTTAVRSALGASRGRLLSEQFVESTLLAVIGCFAGVLLAPPVNRIVLSLLPRRSDVDLALSSGLDLRVLAFAMCVTAAAAVLSGLAPAFYAASAPPVNAIKQQAPGFTGSLGLRKALVISQFALALILLVGAGLFSQTLASLRDRGPGYETSNLVMFQLAPLTVGYEYDESKPVIRRILEGLNQLPEVEQAAVTSFTMLRDGGWGNPITIQADRRYSTEETVVMNAVSPELFDVIHVPILAGRSFNSRDSHDDSRWDLKVAIVNEEFVNKYLDGVNPIGVMTGIGDAPDTPAGMEIVGVVANFQDRGLREPEPQIYYPILQRGIDKGTFYVRTRTSAESAMHAISTTVRDIDPALTVLSLRTLDDQLDRLLGNERLLASLANAYALIATLLAMIGVYAVLSFSAASRTKEIGIRLALGAPRASAGGLIVREAAWLAGIGLLIALPVIWALGRMIRSQLFGVTPLDVTTIAFAAAVLALVCLAASAVPARKAGSTDPLEALRSE